MIKNLNISILCDLYGKLLSDKQREILKSYYDDDLSLSEIAENYQISRQGVRDYIVKGSKTLEELEEKLNLCAHFNEFKINLKRCLELVEDIQDEKIKNILKGLLSKMVGE